MVINPGEILATGDLFDPVDEEVEITFLNQANAIERAAAIENHPFFSIAWENREALVAWASQEAVVTNPFSQILFKLLANIDNVHVRTILLPVVAGEHGKLKSGVAVSSHPWLLWQLCLSIGVNPKRIKISEAVSQFISVLDRSVENPMRSLGILGIGNEMMLQEEYRAIRRCFDKHFPDGRHGEFLEANIGEDITHTMLICRAASSLVDLGFDMQDFMDGAYEGVAARVAYYDALVLEYQLL